MNSPIYQIDAFTDKPFGGNPAAVCPLTSWLDDETLRNIAAENNLSETAFLVKSEDETIDYHLRWFTPEVEMDLCGHATLASAYAVFQFLEPALQAVSFSTLSGILTVTRDGDLLSMNFPARMPAPITADATLVKALGRTPAEVHMERNWLVVYEGEADVRALMPDIALLNTVEAGFAVIVTAPGDDCDFVSRCFAPKAGIPEDPVTGSAHCTLIPFWAERLGKTTLHARQLSRRGGELFCEHEGERVTISGYCALFLTGEILLG
ncbi:MAG: PhzF family phenazine biosynthesis protein [Chloroflexota bacterium]